MTGVIFPLLELNCNKFQIIVDIRLYQKEVITNALYKFIGDFYIHQLFEDQDSNLVKIIFESKDNNIITDTVIKNFCNELIDQQVRYNINAQFGYIRDMIVKEAFKPINSKK